MPWECNTGEAGGHGPQKFIPSPQIIITGLQNHDLDPPLQYFFNGTTYALCPCTHDQSVIQIYVETKIVDESEAVRLVI